MFFLDAYNFEVYNGVMDTKKLLIKKLEQSNRHVTMAMLNYLLQGQRNAGYELAKRIGDELGCSPEVWMFKENVTQRNTAIRCYAETTNTVLHTRRGRPKKND